jgi:hypothetical protein
VNVTTVGANTSPVAPAAAKVVALSVCLPGVKVTGTSRAKPTSPLRE